MSAESKKYRRTIAVTFVAIVDVLAEAEEGLKFCLTEAEELQAVALARKQGAPPIESVRVLYVQEQS